MADEYVSDAFGELFKEDGLVVMSRGLGLRRLVVKYLQHCCQSKHTRTSNVLEVIANYIPKVVSRTGKRTKRV